MFLIYNFHLAESESKNLDNYKDGIKLHLGRDFTPEDEYNISIYGLETFYLAAAKSLDEKHLLEYWKKMNKLWTILNQSKFYSENTSDLKSLTKSLYLKFSEGDKNHSKIYDDGEKICKLAKNHRSVHYVTLKKEFIHIQNRIDDHLLYYFESDINIIFEYKYLAHAFDYYMCGNLFKMVTSLDHLIKHYEKSKIINIMFVDFLKKICPFLVEILIKREKNA